MGHVTTMHSQSRKRRCSRIEKWPIECESAFGRCDGWSTSVNSLPSTSAAARGYAYQILLTTLIH